MTGFPVVSPRLHNHSDLDGSFLNFIAVPEAPRAVKALVMGQDSILVSWRPPAQPNGVVTHYNVYTQAQNAEPHPNKVRNDKISIMKEERKGGE